MFPDGPWALLDHCSLLSENFLHLLHFNIAFSWSSKLSSEMWVCWPSSDSNLCSLFLRFPVGYSFSLYNNKKLKVLKYICYWLIAIPAGVLLWSQNADYEHTEQGRGFKFLVSQTWVSLLNNFLSLGSCLSCCAPCNIPSSLLYVT